MPVGTCIWKRIAELLDSGDVISFRGADGGPCRHRRMDFVPDPALLAITAFVLASRDNIAIMERNSFQPDLTGRSLHEACQVATQFCCLSPCSESAISRMVSVGHALATRLNSSGY